MTRFDRHNASTRPGSRRLMDLPAAGFRANHATGTGWGDRNRAGITGNSAGAAGTLENYGVRAAGRLDPLESPQP